NPTGNLIGVLWGHNDDFYGSAPAFTPDGSRLISGNDDGTVRIWDLNAVERNGILRGHEKYVYDVAFSPDSEQVASAAWDGTVRLWGPATGRQTGLLKHEAEVLNSVGYSRDGRRIATLGRGRGISLWDVASAKLERFISLAQSSFAEGARASFDPDG